MNHLEVGQYWEANAEAWTILSRAGYDTYRDLLNTPAFMDSLPSVEGLEGIDIGCGEGHHTRLLAEQGAIMSGLDISPTFIQHAKSKLTHTGAPIHYFQASAQQMPFQDEAFDFAIACMSMMDIPETEIVLKECYRILRPRAFFQFSISHPCFNPPHRKNTRNEQGITQGIEVGAYFDTNSLMMDEFTFGQAPAKLRNAYPKFKVPKKHQTLSHWFNLLLKVGFRLEYVGEPCPSASQIEQYPHLQDSSVVAYFLHIRVVKPM